ncbi:MAG TPA: TonB family protein [Myxococcota bacterium]|nr:TonB family protein [Myxococcota bacterium]
MDSPWQRLPWTLPGAILVSFALLLVFLQVIAGPARPGVRTAPLDARIVELPSPSVPQEAPHEPVTVPKPPEPTLHRREHVRPAPAAHPVKPPEESAQSKASESAESAAVPSEAAAQPPATRLGGGKLSARALFKPLPDLPEDLRHQKIEVVAVARFEVAADGSSVVELVQPTDNPALNRNLIEALRRWRFFPAIEEGRPVASSVEIRIPISVR